MEPGALHGIRPVEQILIKRLRAQALTAQNEYRPVLTSFLNPRQRVLAGMVASEVGIELHAAGGFTNAEMQRVIFAPDYYEVDPADFELTVLECRYPVKFTTLHHSTILGSFVHHGLERSAFGDIITRDGRWQVAVNTALVTFIETEITQLGRTKVSWRPTSKTEYLSPDVRWQSLDAVVSAVRTDVIVAAGFNLSRNAVKDLFATGSIQVNWLSEKRADAELVPGDMISVRGYGRVQLQDILGLTAKDRWRVALRILAK